MSNPSTGEGAASGAGRGRVQASSGANRVRLGAGRGGPRFRRKPRAIGRAP